MLRMLPKQGRCCSINSMGHRALQVQQGHSKEVLQTLPSLRSRAISLAPIHTYLRSLVLWIHLTSMFLLPILDHRLADYKWSATQSMLANSIKVSKKISLVHHRKLQTHIMMDSVISQCNRHLRTILQTHMICISRIRVWIITSWGKAIDQKIARIIWKSLNLSILAVILKQLESKAIMVAPWAVPWAVVLCNHSLKSMTDQVGPTGLLWKMDQLLQVSLW